MRRGRLRLLVLLGAFKTFLRLDLGPRTSVDAGVFADHRDGGEGTAGWRMRISRCSSSCSSSLRETNRDPSTDTEPNSEKP